MIRLNYKDAIITIISSGTAFVDVSNTQNHRIKAQRGVSSSIRVLRSNPNVLRIYYRKKDIRSKLIADVIAIV